jgi:hypothetical protein
MEAIQIVIGVDIILGPLLTLVIFDSRKTRKVLARDLSFIVLVQIVALMWGAYKTHEARPVFVVFHSDAIYSIARNDVPAKPKTGEVAIPGFWQLPKQVYIPKLSGEEAVKHVLNIFTKDGKEIQYQQDRYLPVKSHKNDILKMAMDMNSYLEKKKNKSQVDAFIQRRGGSYDKYAFYPLEYGPFKSIVGVDRENLELIELLSPVSKEIF